MILQINDPPLKKFWNESSKIKNLEETEAENNRNKCGRSRE